MNAIKAHLTFDSWFDLSPELRGGPGLERHLIYEGGGMLLELVLEQKDKGGCIEITGQLLPGEHETATAFEALVLLENGEGRIQTSTNTLGEFGFHKVDLDGCFTLSILIDGRRLVVEGKTCEDTRSWQITPHCIGDRQ
jgi:hypothetical protein